MKTSRSSFWPATRACSNCSASAAFVSTAPPPVVTGCRFKTAGDSMK